MLDTHVHLWDSKRFRYPWLDDAAELGPHYAPSDFPTNTPITSRIFVEADAEADHARREVRWVRDQQWEGLVGIVAHADLRAKRLSSDLDAMSGERLVVGVRASIQRAPENYLTSRSFIRGLRLVGAHGLTFDACIRATQLRELRHAAVAASDTRIVLDHVGAPPTDAGLDSPEGRAWGRVLDELAELENVFVKLSGLGAASSRRETYERNSRAFVEHAITAFGAERCMYGSDWPVSSTVGAAVPVGQDIDSMTTGMSETERGWVTAKTGMTFYGLPLP